MLRIKALALPTMWGAVAITYKLFCPLAQQPGIGARLATSAVFFAVGTGLTVHVRQSLLRELRQVRRVAGAAQSALLRPLPPRVDGLGIAAAQLSADRGAAMGGDLYEVVATEHGVRVVIGDVRGHGLGAIATVASVLGSFREAAHDEPELAGVLRRLDRGLARYLRASGDPESEEFVTLLLLEIGVGGEILALNCGHPWPYLMSGSGVARLSRADPLPPLGPFPLPGHLPVVACGRLLPDESLVLHTDGAEDARDARGGFFPLRTTLENTLGSGPQAVLGKVFAGLLRHSTGTPTDDVAVLVLRNERQPCEATACPQPATHLEANGF
ncbi:PP2C family protein-serine/threonine phosphatase [Streptomyces sp. NPDC090106]|uniref:PP2C family protein-serine/threonine phosphatase n=1 Tax=Streptomyces sp. NPDC090106 TaxID=3365946 RepID=UPI00380EC844